MGIKSMAALVLLVPILLTPSLAQIPIAPQPPTTFSDTDLFQLALNLEYLEAEFYLWSSYGAGLDSFQPGLTGGGPSSSGGRKANLSPQIQAVAEELGLQEIGHIRIIREFLGNEANPRPTISIDNSTWTAFAKTALPNITTFDPYKDDNNWLLAAFALPYVGLTAYVGANPLLNSRDAKALLGGVLGVEGGQDALLRTILWLRANQTVSGLGIPVQNATGALSSARNDLDRSGRLNDENIVVPKELGAEGNTTTNILAANGDSLSYARSPAETLRIVYGSANASIPGGFYPKGVTGVIGNYYFSNPDE